MYDMDEIDRKDDRASPFQSERGVLATGNATDLVLAPLQVLDLAWCLLVGTIAHSTLALRGKRRRIRSPLKQGKGRAVPHPIITAK